LRASAARRHGRWRRGRNSPTGCGLARLLRNIQVGILFNEHLTENGPVVFRARLPAGR
jgi:hypothetical protein